MDYVNFDLQALDTDQVAELLAYHDRRYWEFNAPEISDARYDEITERLRELAPDHPLLARINTPAVAGDGKVRHQTPMLSLDKAYSLEELLEWAHKFARSEAEVILVEPKYDGISAAFDGRVLATRGDGETGEDISGKLPLIELEAPGYTGVPDRPARGEIVIRDDDFRNIYPNIRKKDGGTYKNPRNAVAGIMGLKDISAMLLQKAKLTLVDYALISEAVPLNMLAERWEELKEKFALLPYPMDGIVLKFADEQFRRELGNTAHHPRGEIAYKFTNRSAQSCLLGVEWSFGKNCLTPVALLEPVDISGITIKRASLHNAQNLLDMDLKIGDTVTVERAGDVIPFIAAREPGHERRDPFITDCPACGSKVVRKGPELCCGNPDCPGAKLQLLTAAVRNLGIERLGEPTVAKLIAHCGVRSLRDLFELTENDIMKIDGFGEKSAANLIGEIRKAREVDDFQLVAALNIPNVGVNIAKLMLEKYSFEELRNLPESELANISGIGPERAAAVAKAMQERQAELDELLAAVSLRRSEKSGDEPTICFTGKMPEKRSYYEKLARERGFRAVDSVTAALTLLVAADINENSTKLRNARKHGVQIMTLAEFLSGNSEKAPGSEPEENLFGDLPLFS